MNKKGFTLIELLAVITIMGILMLVAIPAVSRTIENSRRDTFADNVVTYLNTVRNAVLADELKCGTSSGGTYTWTYPSVSGTPDGTFYVKINTNDSATQDMMESVAKSSWGNSDMEGYITWKKQDGNTEYYAFISDKANHGMYAEQSELNINRGTVVANITNTEKCGTGGDEACTAATTSSVPTQKITGSSDPVYECQLKY